MNFLILFLLFLPAISQAGNIESNLKSPSLIVGVGTDRDLDRADRIALADLISQISVSVEADFQDVKRENNAGLEEFTQSIVHTYSNAVLTNTQREVEMIKGDNYRVYRYIEKAEKGRIFQERAEKIKNYVKIGLRAEDVNELDIAIRHYYWALILLQSHPERNRIFYSMDGDSVMLSVWLPPKIQSLLHDVKMEASNVTVSAGSCVVYFGASNSKGNIGNLNLKYFDGADPMRAEIKDGRGTLFLPEEYYESISAINASIEFEFQHLLSDRPIDEEVKQVAATIFIPFDNRTDIAINHEPEKAIEPTIKDERNVDDERLFEMTDRIVKAIKSRDFVPIRDDFSDQGWEQFMKIMNYGKVRLYEGGHSIEFIRFADRVLIRTIPIVIELTDRNRKIVTDEICPVVENGKIVWVNFAINDRDALDAIRRGDLVGDLNERLLGLIFMEYYKTVFTLKDIRRIDEIISDDALIFVGYVKGTEPQNSKGESTVKSVEMQDFTLQQYSKTEYLDRLEKLVFKNPFVNIQFSELEIMRKSSTKPIYGVQARQDYYSTGYADEGHLLMFTDFTDTTKPRIMYRCWQPKKFLDIDNFKF